MKLREIKAIDLGQGENIPTLLELIQIAKGKIGLQCEVKAQSFSRALVELLTKENLIENSIISSFMFKELLKLQKLESDLKLALLIPPDIGSSQKLLNYSQKAISNNFYAVHPYFNSINEDYVKIIHKNDLLVNVWTVNEESDIQKVLNMNVDGIISDDVERVKKVLTQS